MSDVMEFGFDDGKVIKNQGVELWKQSRPKEKSRVSIISFKKFADVVLARKAKEKGAALSDQEKAEIIAKVDAKLSEQLKKPVDQLTEADRLDIKSPKFAYAFTHYGGENSGIGTIRCLSKYEGNTVLKPEVCCDKFGDADQTVGVVVLTYPVGDDLQVDEDLLKQRKYTGIHIWKLSSKKFQKLQTSYAEARADSRFVPDLSVELDGDPKYQKQNISALSSAVWARETMDPAVRAWVLDQGLRAWKYVSNNLGFEMKKDKLIEKLGGGSAAPQMSSASSAERPALVQSYDTLID